MDSRLRQYRTDLAAGIIKRAKWGPEDVPACHWCGVERYDCDNHECKEKLNERNSDV